jgi:glutathione S-transferase
MLAPKDLRRVHPLGKLSKGRWFLGERCSAADVVMSFPVEAAQARAGLDGV